MPVAKPLFELNLKEGSILEDTYRFSNNSLLGAGRNSSLGGL